MERLLKVEEICERLSLGRTLIYQLIATGEIPSVAIGRARRVREADLDAWVQGKASGRVDGD
jgi:excisionase family DNA binding protein